MRAAWLALLFFGCGTTNDPCQGQPAGCVVVEVEGPFHDLDQLDAIVDVPDSALHARESGGPIPLPSQVAALLPTGLVGSMVIEMVGARAEIPVAYGRAGFEVPASGRVIVWLAAIGGDGGDGDLARFELSADLAPRLDLAAPRGDLAAARGDLAGADLSRSAAPGDGAVDPCAQVSCNSPPAATCVSGTTLRAFAAPGACASGACSYGHVDTTCQGSCQNNACVGGGCTADQCMDRECGLVASLGCDCGGCSAESWCDVYCPETTCQDNLCCLPEGSSCDPSLDFLFKACCPGTYCLSGTCSAN